MEKKYRNYSNEDIIKFAKEVYSIAGLLKKLDLVRAGGNYSNIKKLLQQLNVDCSHWTGKGWSKEKQLKNWSDYKKSEKLKPHLIKIKGHKCETCGLESWLEQLITLEIDHINGNRTDNSLENLRLLCPNCHSLTPTWRGRNKK